MKNRTIQIVMMDKNALSKQMKDLPGLSGVEGCEKKEDLPGLDGVKGKEDAGDGDFEMGYKAGYAKAIEDSMDFDDDDDNDEDDVQCKKKQGAAKMSTFKRIIAGLVKKMSFGSRNATFSPLYSEQNGISIITIDGEIAKRTNEDGMVDVDEISKAMKIAMSAPTSAILLHINSPGGTSLGVQECGDVIAKVAESKPTFTFVDTVCASAAYWLASCTNGIFVTPTSEVGSIGVYAKVMDYSEALKMSGINPQIFSAGDLKTLGQGDKPLTDKEMEFVQKDIDEQYAKFTKVVKEYRGGVADEFLQGQLLSGEKAVPANLADEVVPDMETVLVSLSNE